MSAKEVAVKAAKVLVVLFAAVGVFYTANIILFADPAEDPIRSVYYEPEIRRVVEHSPKPSHNRWISWQNRVSPIDDSANFFTRVRSNEYSDAYLFFFCNEKRKEGYLGLSVADFSFATTEEGLTTPIISRIGGLLSEHEAQAENWLISSDGKFAFAPGGSETAIVLANRLSSNDSILIRSKTDKAEDLTFSLRGLKNSLSDFRRECGW